MGKKWICNDCEYKWRSNKKYGEPAKCPRCNSKNIRRNELQDIRIFSTDWFKYDWFK